MILYPNARFLSPPRVPEAATSQIEAGPTNDPELLENGFKILRFGSEPVSLIRVSDTDFRAFNGGTEIAELKEVTEARDKERKKR